VDGVRTTMSWRTGCDITPARGARSLFPFVHVTEK
jgi:hypothetical protein